MKAGSIQLGKAGSTTIARIGDMVGEFAKGEDGSRKVWLPVVRIGWDQAEKLVDQCEVFGEFFGKDLQNRHGDQHSLDSVGLSRIASNE